MTRRFCARWSLLAASLLWLGACTVQQTAPRAPSADARALESRAQLEARQGNLESAAELYAQLASTTSGTLRSRYLIEGARLHIERGDFATAQRWLTDARAGAEREQQQTIVTLLARVEVEQGRPQAALDMLASLQQPLPATVLRDSAAVRGAALFRLGRPAEAVSVLVEREVWLDNAAEILANQRMIWDGLARMRGTSSPPAATGDPVVDGWLALAPVAAAGADATELRRELLSWRQRYPEHPAGGVLLTELLSAGRSGAAPRQIALLLPLGSPQRREAAIAVRDGFFAGYLQGRDTSNTSVRVYDTVSLGSREAYLRAQLEGAEFIVGPLLREDVDQIVSQAGFVPTLALNFAQTDAALLPGFYQFALAPEDEAAVVARYAIGAGATTAIALVESSEWGYSLLNSFSAEFEALGGRVLDYSGFDTNAQDFSTQIRSLLHLVRSDQRATRLEANLGTQLAFEPRRRQDIDLIFLGADSPAGRLLAPQLRFRGAADIPIYATSEIYQVADAARNSDLNGVMFTDAPWLVQPDASTAGSRRELENYWPQRAASSLLVRLYGMGFDAYHLVQMLHDESRAVWPLQGASGELTLDAEGKIRRTLPLAQFRNGRPQPLHASAPELDRARGSEELIGSR